MGGDGTVLASPIADPDVFIREIVELVADATGVDPPRVTTTVDAVDPEAVQPVRQPGGKTTTTVRVHDAGCEGVTSDHEVDVLTGRCGTG